MKNQKIPKDYRKLLEFVHSNRNQLATDNEMLTNILSTLDEELGNAKNMSDLHMDSNIILSSVKIREDGLKRMFRSNLSIPMLIELYESGKLSDCFSQMKRDSLAVSVVDQLSLRYQPKERAEPQQKKRYDEAVGGAYCPEKTEGAEEEEMCDELVRIREIVLKNRSIEYFRLVLDPSSYGKTIQNVFNVALAIRSKYVALVKSEGRVYVGPYIYSTGEAGHSVVEMTYERYKRLCEEFGITKACL